MTGPPEHSRRASDKTAPDDTQGVALIHRQILQLIALMLIVVVAFLGTRAIAVSNRDMRLRDAAQLYGRGQREFDQGRVREAIDDFRRATVRDRASKAYVLALARALARNHDDDNARTVLMTLREADPEDADANLALARLAAGRSDVTEAARFYHNAIYADWPVERTVVRRAVRFEFIRFLIVHDQSARAVSELLGVAAQLPDQRALHLQVADLFTQAGDYAHALDQYQQAIRLAPTDAAALAGAGMSAFHVGQYTLARSYFRRVPGDRGDLATTRDIVESVLSNDPLANRLGSVERRRRLTADLAYATQRLSACVGTPGRGAAAPDAAGLQAEADRFAHRVTPRSVLDQDTIETGVDLIERIARMIVQHCGAPTPRDRALLLIGRQHGGDTK